MIKNTTIYFISLFMFICLIIIPAPGFSQMEQDQMKSEPMMNPPTKEITVDGIKVLFWVEKMMEHHQLMEKTGVPMEGMKMDADSTHEVSVSLIDEATQKPITDAAINLKIIRPDGSDQIKMAMWMKAMDHYGVDFKMNQKGKYQILMFFKAGGIKHKTGFYYDL